MAAPIDYAASVQGVALRVTRLTTSGTLSTAAGDSVVTSSFIRVSFTPEYEEGDEITEKAADGSICVSFKAPDTLKRVTMEIAICEPDSLLTQLLGGGVLLTRKYGTAPAVQKAVGWSSPQVGENPVGTGVAIEVWSYAVQGGRRAVTDPYYHWIFPYVETRQSGDRAIENGLLATTFEGNGLGNAAFGDGIDNMWQFPAASDRPYSYARSFWAPVGLKGVYTWTPSVTPATVPPIAVEVSDLTTVDEGPGIMIPGTPGYTPPADYILDAEDAP